MSKKKINMEAISNGFVKAVDAVDPYIPKVGYAALLVLGFCYGWMKADNEILKKDQHR